VVYIRLFYRYKGLKFDVHLTEHCNLNCKSCSHFSSLAPKEFADVDVFEKDMKRITELFQKKIYKICLLGGEPLLHPQLLDFVNIAYKYAPKTERQLITNGLLLLKQNNEFWRIFRETNTIINITNYPVNIKYEEIKTKCKSENVQLILEPVIKDFKKYDYDFNGSQSIKKNYKYCSDAINCAQLNNGRLCLCQQVAYIHHFNNYFDLNLEITDKDYIDIHKAKSKRSVLKYMRNPIPFCKYCSLKTRGMVSEWGISKKELNEWKTD
jgi:organic radical activating enzyme